MQTKAKVPAMKTLPSSFAELCSVHPPRPIADDVDYENTVEVVDRLATLEGRSADQEQYLETLSILIEKYDRDHLEEMEVSKPVDRLRRLLDNHGMNASDLGRILGNRSLGAAILRGDRAVSKANAVKLAEHFKMSPAAFLTA
jgi:HTH-type transcriptional regulator/antitoxin HigA